MNNRMMVKVIVMMTWTLQMRTRKKRVQKEERLRKLSGINKKLKYRGKELRVE
jgi:hypothetical protein